MEEKYLAAEEKLKKFGQEHLLSQYEKLSKENKVKLLDEIADIFKILLGVLVAVTFMVIIGTTLLVKMSNTGMMFK